MSPILHFLEWILTELGMSRARSAAQKTAQSVLSHPLAKPILRNIPDPIVQFANAPPAELTRLQETAGVGVRPPCAPSMDRTDGGYSRMMLQGCTWRNGRES